MDTKFQTSFIPKKPLVPTMGGKQSRHVSFFSVIIVLIFIIALLSAVGTFFYSQYLTTRIKQMDTKLAAAEAALDPGLISEWVRLDKRIESGKELLNTHQALTTFFTLLEQMTLKSVRFKNFSYTIAKGQKISITMDGEAESFAAVALQSDEFAKQAKYMSNQLFSNINLDATGNIVFRFTTMVDPALISYPKSVQGIQTDTVMTNTTQTPDTSGDGDTMTVPDTMGTSTSSTTPR